MLRNRLLFLQNDKNKKQAITAISRKSQAAHNTNLCAKPKARLASEEGGRHTPFGSGYSPQFFFGTTDVTGMITVTNETGLVNPGDQAEIGFELNKPVGIETGMRFAIREGGRTVGAGFVTEAE